MARKLKTGGAAVVSTVVLSGMGLALAAANAGACQTTPFERDGKKLTAAIVNPPAPVTGVVDASGCNIGVYFDEGAGEVNGASISGADYYGVTVNGIAKDVGPIVIANTSIHGIHDEPLSGANHGTGVIFTTLEIQGSGHGGEHSATGSVSTGTITEYQKNGVTINGPGTAVEVRDNILTGLGPTEITGQIGIQISRGATALVAGNTIAGDFYIPRPGTGCGLTYLEAAGVRTFHNHFSANERNVCNEGRGGGNTPLE